MKLIDLPDFAKKYKIKGYDVKKVGNEYYQYKVEHHYDKEKKYPVTKFVYIGKIDKDKGLIKSNAIKANNIVSYLEYGLSHFLYSRFKRSLQRSLFNIAGTFADNIIKIGIIKYIFGDISLCSLKASFLTYEQANDLFNFYCSNNQNEIKVKTISNKIEKLLVKLIDDSSDRNSIVYNLRNMNVIIANDNKQVINNVVPSDVKNILDKYGVKYE